MAQPAVTLPENYLLPPEAAIHFFEQKGLVATWSWMDLLREQHNAAFTVAKMMDMDLLTDVRNYTEQALKEGWSIDKFRRNLRPELERAGWWGKKTMIDPDTGEEVPVQLGSAYRINTIYRTNMQSSYAAGRWQQIQNNKDVMPYLMYSAIMDDRVRDDHAAHDGVMLLVDDPFWDSHSPPNGFNCRCSTIQLSQAMAEELYGKDRADPTPQVEMVDWHDPKTGEHRSVPADVDPGWDYNVGKSWTESLPLTLTSKVVALQTIDDEMAQAVEDGPQEPEPIPDLDGFVELGENDLSGSEEMADYRDMVNNGDALSRDMTQLFNQLQPILNIPDNQRTPEQAALLQAIDSERREKFGRWKALKAAQRIALDALKALAAPLWQELHEGTNRRQANAVTDSRAFEGMSKTQEQSVRRAVTDFVVLSNGRLPPTITRIFRSLDSRAYAILRPDGTINVGSPRNNAEEYRRVMFHEIGHHVEYSVLGVKDAANAFIERTRKSDTPAKLRDITGSDFYGDSEIAYEDDWVSPYVGRIYSDGSTEVVSMGVEKFRSVDAMVEFAAKSPFHFDFIVGILRQYRKAETTE